MRLFLLPISTRRTLIYCQKLNQQLSNEQSYVDKVTNKASATWVKWEKFESGWQKKVTQYGNKLFQRIPYEEWGLKSIPPLSAQRKSSELEGKKNVDVAFPSSIIKGESIFDTVTKLGTERQAFHRKWMIWSIVGMPISAPVALIPVIPNIPFFYLCFRAWSHWRALSGSKHLQFLLDHNLIQLSPSSTLDQVYQLGKTDASLRAMEADLKELKMGSGDIQSTKASELETNEEMLLSQATGAILAETLEMPELKMEVDRAVLQVESSLKAKREHQDEKKHETDSTSTNDSPKQ